MDILGILGLLGFLLALVLAYFQLRDYFRPLHLSITYLDCQPADNETSLVLLRLSFVNPASRGRTVYGIDVESKVPGIQKIEPNQEVDSNLQTVVYSLPNVSRRLPFVETLQFPLDIPPNQSLSRWRAIALSYRGIEPVFGTYIHIQATQPVGKGKWKHNPDGTGHYLGVKKRVLAKTNIPLFPAKKVSKVIDIYSIPQEDF